MAWAARQATAREPHDFSVLTREEVAVIDALTSRILPSDDGTPGAREAGVVYFIDRSLSTFNAGELKLYREGVRDLNRRAARKWKGTTSFATLTAPQQDELLHDIERRPFFQAARFGTIVGTFALPTWGGNRGYVGWRLIGLDHQPLFRPPFGFYDADVNGRR
ncbi:MAG: gluconate 2-dehydrogenase subunit 3 family protein [Acidobacteria bacterium]|nr:gluconate 2-dehydrogenase subunit 3 family protein [Acidobacteriota bacterium]